MGGVMAKSDPQVRYNMDIPNKITLKNASIKAHIHPIKENGYSSFIHQEPLITFPSLIHILEPRQQSRHHPSSIQGKIKGLAVRPINHTWVVLAQEPFQQALQATLQERIHHDLEVEENGLLLRPLL